MNTEGSMQTSLESKRKRLYEIIEVGMGGDIISRAYDIVYSALVFINLAVTIAFTFNEVEAYCGDILLEIESLTVFCFALDFIARVLTAKYKFKRRTEWKSICAYLFSFMGIIDILSFLPYYLPMFFPGGIVAFRMFRIIRIFRLFRINNAYDSLYVITEVLNSKKQQLLSSVFIISIMLIASSMCMYSIENEAQPEVFSNAFSGIWWAVSTLLTVGYGDIYPITSLGKLFSIIITILGVGMVAIPTGIISAGFVEQYTRIKKISEYGEQEDIQFIKVKIGSDDFFSNRRISELNLPTGMIVAAIIRGEEIKVPKGNVIILPEDILVIGAEAIKTEYPIELKEISISERNPWVGEKIKDLDVSRQTLFVMIHRDKETIIPNGNTEIKTGDKVMIYSNANVPGEEIITI